MSKSELFSSGRVKHTFDMSEILAGGIAARSRPIPKYTTATSHGLAFLKIADEKLTFTNNRKTSQRKNLSCVKTRPALIEGMRSSSGVLTYQTGHNQIFFQTQRYLLQLSRNEAASNR